MLLNDSATPSPLTPPNGAPTTSADPADLANGAPVVAERAPETAFNLIAYMLGWPGGAPAREGGFPALLGRTLDVRLGRAEKGEASRVAEVNAILRAGYKSAQSIRIEAEENPFSMTPDEVVTFQALVTELSEEKGAGKTARTLAGVGRRMAAVEKSVNRAMKSCKLPRAEVTAIGRTIASAILDVDEGAENRRAYLRAYKA